MLIHVHEGVWFTEVGVVSSLCAGPGPGSSVWSQAGSESRQVGLEWSPTILGMGYTASKKKTLQYKCISCIQVCTCVNVLQLHVHV